MDAKHVLWLINTVRVFGWVPATFSDMLIYNSTLLYSHAVQKFPLPVLRVQLYRHNSLRCFTHNLAVANIYAIERGRVRLVSQIKKDDIAVLEFILRGYLRTGRRLLGHGPWNGNACFHIHVLDQGRAILWLRPLF